MIRVVDIHMVNGVRPHYDVYIGRKVQFHKEFKKDSKWRNRSVSLEAYERWVRKFLWNDLGELRDKILGCWCITTTGIHHICCHGQVLMKLVREKYGST